jgi:5-methylcytosine-specific restriction enzyme A
VELITSKDQIAANLLRFDSYRSSANTFHRDYFYNRLRLGANFVYSVHEGRFIFSPSRFAGYENCTAEKHLAFPKKDGKITTPTIAKHLGKATKTEEAEKAYLLFCTALNISPSNKTRTYWLIELEPNTSDRQISGGESGFPDEVGKYVEGATKRVVVNAYERNEKARSACLIHHGYSCVVCEFNFESRVGAIGAEFIHVHHLTPISSQMELYEIDPINELLPVCPNCHAMLHKSHPPFTIEELKALIRKGCEA